MKSGNTGSTYRENDSSCSSLPGKLRKKANDTNPILHDEREVVRKVHEGHRERAERTGKPVVVDLLFGDERLNGGAVNHPQVSHVGNQPQRDRQEPQGVAPQPIARTKPAAVPCR